MTCQHENLTPYYLNGVDGIQGYVCEDCGENIDLFLTALREMMMVATETK